MGSRLLPHLRHGGGGGEGARHRRRLLAALSFLLSLSLALSRLSLSLSLLSTALSLPFLKEVPTLANKQTNNDVFKGEIGDELILRQCHPRHRVEMPHALNVLLDVTPGGGRGGTEKRYNT